MRVNSFLSVVGLGAVVAACSAASERTSFEDPQSPPGPAGNSGAPSAPGFGGANSSTADAGADDTAAGCSKMDIVFVVDNSDSMTEEQQNLGTNFPNFVKVIDDYRAKGGASLDYRIAITTTDITSTKGRGAFVTKGESACDPGPARAWLERGDGDVASMFACRAKVGTGGSGDERPLESLKYAFTERAQDQNAGFVRDDALLAMIILTDEDEPKPLREIFNPEMNFDPYLSTFDQVKKDRSRWAAAVIAGEKSCHTSLGDATQATNLRAFVKKLGTNGAFGSICTGDLTTGLEAALNAFDLACKAFTPGPK